MKNLSNKTANALGVLSFLSGIFIQSFLIKGMLGTVTLSAFIALGFLFLHKGITGKTFSEK